MTSSAKAGDGACDGIVVGTGSAGCVLAARLSAKGRRVLLLESAGADGGRWLRSPLGSVDNLARG